MFGNFTLNAGLSQLQDLGGKFQKIREDLEQNIESSLRANVAPGAGSDAAGVTTSVDGSVSFAEWEGYSVPNASTEQAKGQPNEGEDTAVLASVFEGARSGDTNAAEITSVRPDTGGNLNDQQGEDEPQQVQPDSIQQDSEQSPGQQQEPSPDQNLVGSDRAELLGHPDNQAVADTAALNEPAVPSASASTQQTLLSQQQEATTAASETESIAGSEASANADETSQTTADEKQHIAASSTVDEATALTDSGHQTWSDTSDHSLVVSPQQPEAGEQLEGAEQPEATDKHDTDHAELAGSQQNDSAPEELSEAKHQIQSDIHMNGVQTSERDEGSLSHAPPEPASVVQHSLPKPTLHRPASEDLSKADMADMDLDALWTEVQKLQMGLHAREKQLERQGQQLSDMQHVQQQLQAKNEELVTKAAKVSEEDMAAVQAECERRLGAAERKAYALAKERDALRRGSDKLSSANDLLKEKDNIIAQVMEEGERLSKKQSSMEGTIKKLRQQIRDLEAGQSQAATKLAGEESKLEAAVKARQQAEASLAASVQQHKIEAEQQKQQYEALLARARSSQAAAEEKAATSAKEGLEKRAREAESQAQQLADTVEELRLALDRQRASTELREEGLRGEVRDLEARCQAAEARHQDLAANIPEATRPLLRQLEAMQASAAANSQAWAAAEASLTGRLNDAEAAAAGAGEREKRAWEKVQAANTRLAASAAALDAVKAELTEVDAEMDKAQGQQRTAEMRAIRAEEELSVARQAQAASHDKQVQLERNLAHQLAEQQAQSLAASDAAEERIQALEQRLDSHAQASPAQQTGAGDPPAMAAPGYEWQLVRSSGKALSARNLSSASLASTSTGEQGADGLHPSLGQHPRPPAGSAGEAERLRMALRQKEDQVASLQSQLTDLEATRDSLAEEVIAAAGSEEAARAAEMSAASAREEAAAAEQQLLACTEMLGEKEERLEELRADLQDVKQLYKDQIEFMVEQLAHLTQKGLVVSPAKSVAEQSPVQQNTDGLEQDVAS